MLGCGRRGHPAVTHRPTRPRDGRPQPDGAGRSHREQPCEESVGDNPSRCQAPHLLAVLGCQQSRQPREEVGRSLVCLQAGSEQNRRCSPQRTNPHASAPSAFRHLSGNPASQPSKERLPVLQQQLGSICPSVRPSVRPSICPGNGLNSLCPTP